jgi:competence protein ComEC
VYRCPDHGIDIFKLLDDVLPDNGDGRKRLKYLAITHAHDDHITGIGDLYDRYAVEWLWVPQYEDRKQVAKHFGEYQRVLDEHLDEQIKQPQGSRTPLNEKDPDLDICDGVTVRCFSPPGYIKIEETLSEDEAKQLVHENCLVLKIAYEGASVILTGDSNLACWNRIVGYYQGRSEEDTGTEVLTADILHASHHGSRTFFKDDGEESEASLDALSTIAPDAVVVSVGENNPHNHPHEDMMEAYREQVGDENVFETRHTGTVTMEVDRDVPYRIVLDPGGYAEDYGWDEEDDDGEGDDEDRHGGGGGGLAAALALGAGAAAAAAIAKRRRKGSPTRLDDEPAA